VEAVFVPWGRRIDRRPGAVLAQTACGKVDIGIRDGVAAWLDLDTRYGTVQTDLDATERPEAGEDAVEVRARSSFGDITIRRAPTPPTDPVTTAMTTTTAPSA
jgi:hypothetical protein